MGINSLLPWKNSNVEIDKKAYEEFRLRMSVLNDARVLVVGGGGREHAIVDALSRSSHVGKIYCAPGNAGIAAPAECVPIKDTEIDKLLDFVKENGIDLTVVGPEASLSAGIVDIFTEAGQTIFGPTKAAVNIVYRNPDLIARKTDFGQIVYYLFKAAVVLLNRKLEVQGNIRSLNIRYM